MKITKKRLITSVGFLASVAVITAVFMVSEFITNNDFKYSTPITMQFKEFVTATPKQKTTVIVKEAKAESKTVDPLTPDQRYACDKFGKDCVTAIAIMRAESHYRHDAININSNGSVDFGCMQINSIHLKNIDTTKVNLLNCQDNIDVAYQIYSQQKGFQAWATYSSGAYKAYLINK